MRLLTLNSHEAWVHQLGWLGQELDIVDGLPGRYCNVWDERMRPWPDGARRVTLAEARERSYDCVIVHSITDLLDARDLSGARLLVLHATLAGRARREGMTDGEAAMRRALREYMALRPLRVVAVSAAKACAWGVAADVVENAVDVDSYPPWQGDIAAGLRIANQVNARRELLHWDFHEAAFAALPLRLVGHNPDIVGVNASASWDDLKLTLSRHRYYVHTARPGLEDGCNMAMLEAMAAGLPVLGNAHPDSPIVSGINGYLCDDPHQLADHARRLLADPALARRLGEAARATVRGRYDRPRWVAGFMAALAGAVAGQSTSPAAPAMDAPPPGQVLALCQQVYDAFAAGRIEDGIGALDRLMTALVMPRGKRLDSLDDLLRLVREVSDRLAGNGDYPAAELLLSGTMILAGSMTVS